MTFKGLSRGRRRKEGRTKEIGKEQEDAQQ